MKTCIIAAPKSGSGKTVITSGIIRAFAKRGYRVQPFKTGPDYLDGIWHSYAAKNSSYNLDLWMIKKDLLVKHFNELIIKSDIGIIEGVMGVYDGFEGTIEGSTADLAITLNIPVILVIDCKGISGSVAPIVYGFKYFNENCRIAGVILNNTGSIKHEAYCRSALSQINIPVLGCIPRSECMVISHRHLGLKPADNNLKMEETLNGICSIISKHIDFDRLYKLMECQSNAFTNEVKNSVVVVKCRIAVALDAAFQFYYHANFDLLKANGAELVYFSPLNDSKLPCDIQGLYIGGGYPEEYAEQLSSNHSMRESILEFAFNGGCIYAECGGFMYLGRSLINSGNEWPMCGFLDIDFEMGEGKRKNLGYREVKLNYDTTIGKRGLVFRGHEFHYSHQVGKGKSKEPFTIVSRSNDNPDVAGVYKQSTLASYIHIHFLSCPDIAKNFVETCMSSL